MLKKLRKKFIFISMFAILVTISVFYLAITYSNYKKTIERADILTNIIANNDGKMPETLRQFQMRMQKKLQDMFLLEILVRVHIVI